MKKIISTVLAFAIMGTMSTDVLAYSNESYYSVPSMIQYTIENDNMGDIVNRHQLLNQENEQVATCLDCENGYIIYDVNDCIIEYSQTAESPYANYDDIVYYGGPLEYVTEENGEFFDITTGNNVSDFDFEPIESSEYSIQTFSSTSNIRDVSWTVKGKTRLLNYNGGDLIACGSLATTILLFYYYDYVSHDYLKSAYANDPQKAFETLRKIIEPQKIGTNYEELTSGIEKAYKQVTSLTSLETVTRRSGDYWGMTYYNVNALNTPVIAGLANHPIYKGHWVVAYGTKLRYNGNKIIYKWYIVNDGWGNDNVVINSNYCDGIVYLTKCK